MMSSLIANPDPADENEFIPKETKFHLTEPFSILLLLNFAPKNYPRQAV